MWSFLCDIAAAVWRSVCAVWSFLCDIAAACWRYLWHAATWTGTTAYSWVTTVAGKAHQVLLSLWHAATRLHSAVVAPIFAKTWSMVSAIGKQTWSLVSTIGKRIWSMVSAVGKQIWSLASTISTKTWSLVSAIGKKIWSLQSRAATLLRVTIAVPFNLGMDGLIFLRDTTVRVGCAAWEQIKRLLRLPLDLLCALLRLLYAQFQQLTRAWWRIVPAGLAVQTCLRFGLAILRSPSPAASAVLGFALASWAVGIIAVILVRDLCMRSFAWSDATNRQYLATDYTSEFFGRQSRVDNLLVYVDLGAVAATRWTITNAGNVLRLLIQHGASWTGQMLRRIFEQGWRAGRVVFDWVVLPVLRKIKAAVLLIWNSPLLSTAAALGSLWLLWAHHSSTYRWVLVERILVLSQTKGTELLRVTLTLALEYSTVAAEMGYEWGTRAAGVMMATLNSTTEQLVAAAEAGDIESPRLAWVVWIVIVFATKTQAEIRIKTLMWPFIVLWVTALLGYAQQLPLVMIGVLCWCGAAVRVRNYEQRERDRVRSVHNQWMQRRPSAAGPAGRQAATAAAAAAVANQPAPPLPTGKPKERKFKDQTECSICLESLSVRPDGSAAGGEDAIGMLPCGHCFHAECIGEWLQREARCPMCRQSARGIDRVLEIVF